MDNDASMTEAVVANEYDDGTDGSGWTLGATAPGLISSSVACVVRRQSHARA